MSFGTSSKNLCSNSHYSDKDSMCESGNYYPSGDDENLFFVNEIDQLNDSLEENELTSLASGYSDDNSNCYITHSFCDNKSNRSKSNEIVVKINRNESNSMKMYQVVAQAKSIREQSPASNNILTDNSGCLPSLKKDDPKVNELLSLRQRQQMDRTAARFDDLQKQMILAQLSMLAEQQAIAKSVSRNSSSHSKVIRAF